ncbi:PrsW family intramembrane metalloprotease [Streptomyces sp. Act143]|uniref:CdiA C-terminal domain-containing protein n=1 Tax=Streptomyces sp. Act143 TaxID=2200760 RepID=UPI000D67AB25|nr:PrsW family glutamic-type intramembrane protease [Streptomyces sp. Act143]PWI17768.1 PrsW family intramembrane metalloprotease [Streptomyces sp. Act143]
MTVLMVAATLYGVVQLLLLSSPTRSVSVATTLLAVLVGVYACGTAAALLEITYTRLIAEQTGESLIRVVNTTSYTTAPWVEELLKISPLFLAGLYVKVRRQWGLADFTVLGAALGAGFGLLEAVLRYALDADRAIAAHGGWIVPDSLSAPYVPGPVHVLTSWLPAPVASLDLSRGGEVTVATFTHLVWSTLAGLGVGVLWRASTWWKALALVPLGAAVAHHTLNNYAATHARTPADDWLDNLHPTLGLAPLAALLLAMTADTVVLHRAKRELPDTLLPAERRDGDTIAAVLSYASLRPPWTPLIALRFLRLRRSLFYEAATGLPHPLAPLRRAVSETASRIAATDGARAWRTPDLRARIRAAAGASTAATRTRRLLILLIPCVLVLPSVVFLGLGSFKSTVGVQDYFTTGTGSELLRAFAVAALAWIAWQLSALLRTWRHAATVVPLLAEPLATHRFRTASALGAATTGTLLLWRSLGEAGTEGQAVPPAHLLDALDRFLVYLGFALLLLSLLALFPPGAGLALAGVTATGEGALGAALAARLGLAGVALMVVGAAGGGGTAGAADGEDGRAQSDGGNSRNGSIDETEKAFSAKERRIAETLQNEGRHVKALKESSVEGQRTPDAVVDGVPTEFKTLDPGASVNSVKNTLNTAKKQARDAVVDARGSGLDEAGAREGLGKFLRNNPPGRMNSIRIIGDDYHIIWP